MTKNIGTNESYLRIGLGALAAVAALGVVKSRWGKSLLGLAAFSGLQSGITRHCAVKQLFGKKQASEIPGKNFQYNSDSATVQSQNRAM